MRPRQARAPISRAEARRRRRAASDRRRADASIIRNFSSFPSGRTETLKKPPQLAPIGFSSRAASYRRAALPRVRRQHSHRKAKLR